MSYSFNINNAISLQLSIYMNWTVYLPSANVLSLEIKNEEKRERCRT